MTINKADYSCIVWANPDKYTNPKARAYRCLTTNTTPAHPIAQKTTQLSAKKHYKRAFFVSEATPDAKIAHFLSISSVQEPVIISIPAAENFLGWTDFEYREAEQERM